MAGQSEELPVPQSAGRNNRSSLSRYEEPPGNGGFLLNGGRLYLDMGHIEYASPECLHCREEIVTYDLAGDELLQAALVEFGASDRVSFIKNNVDHHTGAILRVTNYLMRREAQFTPPVLGTLLSFLATRQLFTGAASSGGRRVDGEVVRPGRWVGLVALAAAGRRRRWCRGGGVGLGQAQGGGGGSGGGGDWWPLTGSSGRVV